MVLISGWRQKLLERNKHPGHYLRYTVWVRTKSTNQTLILTIILTWWSSSKYWPEDHHHNIDLIIIITILTWWSSSQYWPDDDHHNIDMMMIITILTLWSSSQYWHDDHHHNIDLMILMIIIILHVPNNQSLQYSSYYYPYMVVYGNCYYCYNLLLLYLHNKHLPDCNG